MNKDVVRKTIGIITFHAVDNYGALLQAYALQQTIMSRGYKVFFLDHVLLQVKKNTLLNIIKRIYFFPRHTKRKKASQEFRKKKLCIVPVDTPCDVLVCGSDQIWNFDITKCDGSYFGIGIANRGKCISYAASMGKELSTDYVPLFQEYIKNVGEISVREKTTKNYIEKLCHQSVENVLDPTFLLKKNDWINLIPKMKKKEKPYLFVYSVSANDKQFVDIVNRVSSLLHLEVICPMKSVYKQLTYKNIRKTFGTQGPEWFLYYLMNADFVVTSSFHGTALSLNFQKKFLSVVPMSGGQRLIDIMELCECQDRLIKNGNSIPVDKLLAEIDYERVNKILERERDKSIAWLFSAINKRENN